MVAKTLYVQRALNLLVRELLVGEAVVRAVDEIQGIDGDFTARGHVFDISPGKRMEGRPNGSGSTRGHHLVLLLEGDRVDMQFDAEKVHFVSLGDFLLGAITHTFVARELQARLAHKGSA